MDTELLIKEVSKKKLLWDRRSKQHHNRYMLDKSWGEIATVMDCSIKEARTKWKNLKDHFRKEYKKEQELVSRGELEDTDVDSVSWSHYKSLLFLKDQFVPRRQPEKAELDIKLEKADETDQTKSEDEKVSLEDNKEVIDYMEVPAKDITDEVPVTVKKLIPDINEMKYRSVKLKTLMKNQNKSCSSRGPAKKRLKTLDSSTLDIQIDDLKVEGLDKKLTKANENYHFVMSLLPHLDRLSPAKRLAVQIKIQQAVFSAIYGTNRSSSDSTTSYDSTSSFYNK